MFFVQEEQFETVSEDVTSKNSSISAFDITLPTKYINKIKEDYKTLIDVFIEVKEFIKSEDIVKYIGEAVQIIKE